MSTAETILKRLEAVDLSPLIGSEVHLGKEALISGEFAAGLRELLERRGVLVFPQVKFTDREQIAFTKTMGTFLPEM